MQEITLRLLVTAVKSALWCVTLQLCDVPMLNFIQASC
jgi:hypothetical protein